MYIEVGLNSYIYIIIWNKNLNQNYYLDLKDKGRFNFLNHFFKIRGKFSHIIYEYIKEEVEQARQENKMRVVFSVKFQEKFILKIEPLLWLYIDIFNNLNLDLSLNFEPYFNYYFNEWRWAFLKRNFFFNYNLLSLNTKAKKILLLFYRLTHKNSFLILNVKPGLFWKKFNFVEKRLKRSNKLVELMFSHCIKQLNESFKKKIIINLIGVKNLNIFILNLIKKYLKFEDLIFIYTPVFYYKNKKNKKIRSIKRSFLKKFLKKDLKTQKIKKIKL